MSETEEPTTRSPVLGALLLVGAAWGVGALVLPFGFSYLVIAGWTGGGAAALVVAGLIVAVVAGLLVAAASLVPDVSHLTSTMGGRVGWALIVAVVGTLGWLFAFSIYREAEPMGATSAALFGGVPFALVAGLLLRRWYFKVGTIALMVASGVGLLASLAGTVPSELDTRLAAADVDRGEIFVTQIPGYHRVQYQPTMEPDDPRSTPPERYLSLVAYPGDPTPDCLPNPNDTMLAGSPCTVEQPGLTYTVGVTTHQYFYRKGTMLLQLVGSIAVDRDLLRGAILTAVPTADPAIYTTEVDGYEATMQGMPPGTQFVPTDKTQVPMATYVEVSASRVPQAGGCAAFQNSGTPSPYLECVAESPDLHYERMADKHVYYAQHGSTEVRVIGGLDVDRDVLRHAAVSARPATDDELMTRLPPANTPAPATFMDRLKEFANGLFG